MTYQWFNHYFCLLTSILFFTSMLFFYVMLIISLFFVFFLTLITTYRGMFGISFLSTQVMMSLFTSKNGGYSLPISRDRNFQYSKIGQKIDYNFLYKDLRLDAYFSLFSCRTVFFSALFVYANTNRRK